MRSPKPGERVFAVLDADEESVRVLGFGVYAGRERPPDWLPDPDIRWLAELAIENGDKHPVDVQRWYDLLVEAGELTHAEADERVAKAEERLRAEQARPMAERVDDLVAEMGRKPKIVLDGGIVVWGHECWWGLEDEWEKFAKGRMIVGAEKRLLAS